MRSSLPNIFFHFVDNLFFCFSSPFPSQPPSVRRVGSIISTRWTSTTWHRICRRKRNDCSSSRISRKERREQHGSRTGQQRKASRRIKAEPFLRNAAQRARTRERHSRFRFLFERHCFGGHSSPFRFNPLFHIYILYFWKCPKIERLKMDFKINAFFFFGFLKCAQNSFWP